MLIHGLVIKSLRCELDLTFWQARENPFLFAKDLDPSQRDDLGKLLDWVVEKTELLRKLNEHLARLIRAWDRFHQDQPYFHGLKNEVAVASLTDLVDILQELNDLKRMLRSCEKTCEKAEKIVSPNSPDVDS